MKQDEIDYKRLLLALFMCTGLLVLWQYTIELPRRQQMQRIAVLEAKKAKERQVVREAEAKKIAEETSIPREDRLARSPRVTLSSGKLDGTLRLIGLRFDDLKLARYRDTIDPQSPEVTLLNPRTDEQVYFAHVGWLSPDQSAVVPGEETQWQADSDKLTPERPVTLRWDNGRGQIFTVEIAMDQDYLFTLNQKVENRSGAPITLQPYGYINRVYKQTGAQNYILHDGPIGGLDGKLNEIGYETLRKEGPKRFENTSGWLGFTDKYWLTALIPSSDTPFTGNFSFYQSRGQDRYQVDYLGQSQKVEAGASQASTLRLFAGAKEIKVLDRYTHGDPTTGMPPVPLFDRSVDFGSLYFLTKPLFLLLNFFYTHIGNFGIAILLLTIVVKLCMLPLANKAYISTSQMRALQPDMEKLRERFGNDKMKFNQEMMALYKREKVNPAAGCLPVLVQMPVFFALYKVLFVTIEMRHAHFLGWIRDLSVADPSNIFTLFGLIAWDPPRIMHIGILPILMCVSMAIQMAQQPKPTDPVQAKVMKFMPYILLVVFAPMPAGLVLYWTWSNILSIIQQYFITRRYKRRKEKVAA